MFTHSICFLYLKRCVLVTWAFSEGSQSQKNTSSREVFLFTLDWNSMRKNRRSNNKLSKSRIDAKCTSYLHSPEAPVFSATSSCFFIKSLYTCNDNERSDMTGEDQTTLITFSSVFVSNSKQELIVAMSGELKKCRTTHIIGSVRGIVWDDCLDLYISFEKISIKLLFPVEVVCIVTCM